MLRTDMVDAILDGSVGVTGFPFLPAGCHMQVDRKAVVKPDAQGVFVGLLHDRAAGVFDSWDDVVAVGGSRDHELVGDHAVVHLRRGRDRVAACGLQAFGVVVTASGERQDAYGEDRRRQDLRVLPSIR